MAEFLGDCWGYHLLHYFPSLVNVWHILFGSQDCEVSTGGNDEKEDNVPEASEKYFFKKRDIFCFK